MYTIYVSSLDVAIFIVKSDFVVEDMKENIRMMFVYIVENIKKN